jgi:hypothetical protein
LAFYRLAKPAKTMTVAWGDDTYGQCELWNGITNAVQVTGGIEYSLALLNNGTVVGWGYNGASSSALVPTNLVGVAMIASGWQHNVALRTNGSVTAWGDNFYGEINVPAGLTNVTVIAAQALHSLALKTNGTVVAWGLDSGYGDASVPAGLTNVTAISAGSWHNLAVSNGYVVAWGYNGSGQCTVPTNLSNVVDVAAGALHSVALKQDGTVVCWGDNTNGESAVPSGLTNIVAIAAGGYLSPPSGYTLALKKDGTPVFWGNGKIATSLGGLTNLIAIGGGPFHALAIRTGPPTPVITLAPVDAYQVPGSNATFTAKGAGLYGVAYQWQTNGVNLPGATNALLTLTNVQPPMQLASYRVVVGNEVGSIVSSNAQLHFVTPPVINSLTLPSNQVAIYQSNLTLSVSASAPGLTNGFPLAYQWQFNGTNLAGATAASNTIHATANSFGTYSVLVSNAAGSTNASWQVAVYYPGFIVTQQPTNQYQIAGGSINFYGSGVSSNAVTYQWALNGSNLAGATNASLTLTNVSAAQQGYYNFKITSAGNSLTSSNAYFYLVTPPTITAQTLPTNRVCIYGNYLSLAATVTALYQTNGFPLQYQWRYNGTNLPGATTTNYSFTVNDTNGGIYSLVTSNLAGSASASWQVTVTNAINVTNDLLLIYNTNSVDSTTVLNYYLAHRPNVAGANVLGIGCSNVETILPDYYTNVFVPQIQAWQTNNPTKRPQYVVLFYDVPSRVNTNNVAGDPWIYKWPSIQYRLHTDCLAGWNPFVTSINMASTNDCIAYINKLQYFGTNYSPGKLIISASAAGYGNTNYILDNVRTIYPGVSYIISNTITGLLAAGVPTNCIFYLDGYENGITLPHLTNEVNVAGYITWGAYTSLGGNYPINTNVAWYGHSSWWIMRSEESFNGQRQAFGQGNFVKWFASNAFGGTNYSNTPIGGPTYTDEPQATGTDNAIYFGLWAAGKNLAICAWNSYTVPYSQVVGDPFVTR